MRKFVSKNCFLAALVCVLVLELVFMFAPAPHVQAQGGYFGVGTFSQKILSNVTAPQIVAVNNVGQSSHWLTFCVTGGTVSALVIELDASHDGTNWFAISDQANPTSAGAFEGCQVLEASGYFPQLRVNLAQFNAGGGGGVLSAWYSATQTAIPSSGLMRSGKASQPVTFQPDATISSTTLKSTPLALSASQASVYQVAAYNPNGAAVFVVITPVLKPDGTTTSAVYGITNGASRDIAIPNGMQTAANSTVACATSATGAGDPVSGCVVTVNLKAFATISAGSANGTVIPN